MLKKVKDLKKYVSGEIIVDFLFFFFKLRVSYDRLGGGQ